MSDEQLAAQVDAAFSEQLGSDLKDATDTAHTLMTAFLDAGCTYLNGDRDAAHSQLHQHINETSNPARTTLNLCVAGAMAIAGCLEHAAPPCEHDDGEQCDKTAVFDLDSAGHELTRAALLLCNAAVDDERDDMAGVLKSIYDIGGFKGLATMLAALVELFATVLDDLTQ